MAQMPVKDGNYNLNLNLGQEIILDTANKVADKNVVVSNINPIYYEHHIIIDTNSSSTSGYKFSFILRIPSSTKITNLKELLDTIYDYYTGQTGYTNGIIPASGNAKNSTNNSKLQIFGVYRSSSTILGLVYGQYTSTNITTVDTTTVSSINTITDNCYKITNCNHKMYEHNILAYETSSSTSVPGGVIGIKLITENNNKIVNYSNSNTDNTNNFLFELSSRGYTSASSALLCTGGIVKNGSTRIETIYQIYATGSAVGSRALGVSYFTSNSTTYTQYNNTSFFSSSKLSSYPLTFVTDIVVEIVV